MAPTLQSQWRSLTSLYEAQRAAQREQLAVESRRRAQRVQEEILADRQEEERRTNKLDQMSPIARHREQGERIRQRWKDNEAKKSSLAAKKLADQQQLCVNRAREQKAIKRRRATHRQQWEQQQEEVRLRRAQRNESRHKFMAGYDGPIVEVHGPELPHAVFTTSRKSSRLVPGVGPDSLKKSKPGNEAEST